jgi:tetratricopeptide (TPR) repeat protein
VVIIYNGFQAPGMKERAQQTGWAKLAAGAGLAAVNYDSHRGGEESDFDELAAYLRAHADELGVDAQRLAFLAWSGHVSRGLGVAMSAQRRELRAAVFLYGIGNVDSLRLDLPTLLVRAGRDTPGLNRSLDALVARGLAANAPITVINYGSGLHGFDIANDNDMSREIIDRILAFMVSYTMPRTADAVTTDLAVVRAAAALYNGQFAAAAAAYEPLVRADTASVDLQLRLGEALLGAGQYERALEHLQRAWDHSDKGRVRDIGYPAAVAAAKLHNYDAAAPWVRLLMTRGMTADMLRADANLEGLRADPRFEALLRGSR